MSYTDFDEDDVFTDRPIRAWHLCLLVVLFAPLGVAVKVLL